MINDQHRKIILTKMHEVLKPANFKKQGVNFFCKANDVTCIVQLQSSQFSTQNDLSITINLGVFSFLIAEKISYTGKPQIASSHWRERISEFTGNKNDRWWHVKKSNKAEKAEEEIAKTLHNTILPRFDTLNSTEKLKSFWETDERLIWHFYDGRNFLHLLK